MDCESSEKGVAALKHEYDVLVRAGLKDTHEWLDSEDQILEKVPQLSRENIKVRLTTILHHNIHAEVSQGWKAVFSHEGGWLAAAKAINAIGEYCQQQGVKFGFGR